MGSKGDPIDGVMLLDKPSGMSSNWALQLTRRLIDARRGGHTGTLDPMASGLLPLAFGNATKYSQDLLNATKRYLATVQFGAATDTMDATGTVTEKSDHVVTREELEAVLPRFRGKIKQVPPMYSALKHDGKNLYDLARRGIAIERKPREVEISILELVSFTGSQAVLDARVTKGTYIRVLADDIGRALGSFAHLSALRRTEVGDLRLADAVPFAVIDDPQKTVAERRSYLKGADFLLQGLPEVVLGQSEAERLVQGQRIAAHSALRGQARAYGPNRWLLGVVEIDERGTLHPSRMIRTQGN